MFNAKPHVKILPVDHMPTANRMAWRRIVYAKKDGPLTQAILLLVVWISTSATPFMDHRVNAETTLFVKMCPEDTLASVRQDLQVTLSGCVSIWTNVRNHMLVVKVQSVII